MPKAPAPPPLPRIDARLDLNHEGFVLLSVHDREPGYFMHVRITSEEAEALGLELLHLRRVVHGKADPDEQPGPLRQRRSGA
jgi:hypothetical protein